MWALATGTEPLPGSNKSRIVYKVRLGSNILISHHVCLQIVSPVVPGQPPPQIVFRPAVTEAPAPTFAGRSYPPAPKGRPLLGTHIRAPAPNKALAPPRQNPLIQNPPRQNLLMNNLSRQAVTTNKTIVRALTTRTVVRPVTSPRYSVASSNGPRPGSQLMQRLQQGQAGDHSYGGSQLNRSRPMDHNYGGSQLIGLSPMDHSYGQSKSPDIQEIPEKDPLALDDNDLEALDPYESESLIIPSINPDVDKDLAADDEDDLIAA